MMASNKKEKWKSIIESAFVEPTIRDNSSFISRVNSLSTFKDMHRNASEGSIRHDNLRDKFKAVKNRLALQKDTQMTEMKKLKDTSPYSETKTFTQKISSFDKLLNSLKLSPLAKDKFNLVLDDDSCKKNLVNSFDSSDRNFTIKVHDEDHNLIEENEFDIKESWESLEIEPFEYEEPEVKHNSDPDNSFSNAKSNLFNIMSICNKEKSQTHAQKPPQPPVKTYQKPPHPPTVYSDPLPCSQDSITQIRRNQKKLYKESNQHIDLENISKTLEFGPPEEELKTEEVPASNPFNSYVERDIEAIEEASNETFTTDRELCENDDSLFALPQTTISQSSDQGSPLNSFKDNDDEVELQQIEVKDPEKIYIPFQPITNMSFQHKESSENQIKEMFSTSLMISSPDFEMNTHKFNDKEIEAVSDINLSGRGSSHSLSPIEVHSESKINISPNPISKNENDADYSVNKINEKWENKINFKLLPIFIRSLNKISKKYQNKNLAWGFRIIKEAYQENRFIEVSSQQSSEIVKVSANQTSMVSKDKHEYSIKTVGSMDKSQTISQEVQRDSSRADLNKLSQYEIFMLLKTSVIP